MQFHGVAVFAYDKRTERVLDRSEYVAALKIAGIAADCQVRLPDCWTLSRYQPPGRRSAANSEQYLFAACKPALPVRAARRFDLTQGLRYIFTLFAKIGCCRMEWLRSIRLFVGVVQNGSLSAAGRQHGLSPASVSRHISALEESVGGRLLNRTSRKLTLTEAGEIYFQKVEHILQQILEANESVAQLQSVPRGTLRVHSRMLVGHQYIVPALPDFMKQYPDITVDLLLSNHAVDLVENNIDVDIRIGKLVEFLDGRAQTCRKRAYRLRDGRLSQAQRAAGFAE